MTDYERLRYLSVSHLNLANGMLRELTASASLQRLFKFMSGLRFRHMQTCGHIQVQVHSFQSIQSPSVILRCHNTLLLTQISPLLPYYYQSCTARSPPRSDLDRWAHAPRAEQGSHARMYRGRQKARAGEISLAPGQISHTTLQRFLRSIRLPGTHAPNVRCHA